jgi:hypothetical protein
MINHPHSSEKNFEKIDPPLLAKVKEKNLKVEIRSLSTNWRNKNFETESVFFSDRKKEGRRKLVDTRVSSFFFFFVT